MGVRSAYACVYAQYARGVLAVLCLSMNVYHTRMYSLDTYINDVLRSVQVWPVSLLKIYIIFATCSSTRKIAGMTFLIVEWSYLLLK